VVATKEQDRLVGVVRDMEDERAMEKQRLLC